MQGNKKKKLEGTLVSKVTQKNNTGFFTTEVQTCFLSIKKYISLSEAHKFSQLNFAGNFFS